MRSPSTPKRGAYEVGAELVGTFLFALLGASTPAAAAPWGNGIGLAVAIYITANLSGGHLNPAVTAAAVVTGYLPAVKGLAYVVAQIVGSVLASLLQAVIIPGVVIGDPKSALGGFAPAHSVGAGQAFAWELITTFILVSSRVRSCLWGAQLRNHRPAGHRPFSGCLCLCGGASDGSGPEPRPRAGACDCT
eukprot:jgi/Botrbrau1/3934/Bobra.0365s0010.1